MIRVFNMQTYTKTYQVSLFLEGKKKGGGGDKIDIKCSASPKNNQCRKKNLIHNTFWCFILLLPQQFVNPNKFFLSVYVYIESKCSYCLLAS